MRVCHLEMYLFFDWIKDYKKREIKQKQHSAKTSNKLIDVILFHYIPLSHTHLYTYVYTYDFVHTNTPPPTYKDFTTLVIFVCLVLLFIK